MDVLVEAGFQPGVRGDEALHRPGIARDYDHQLVAVVLHCLEQGFDGLAAEVVFAARSEGVGLVDKQYAAERAVNYLRGFHGGLADISGNQPGAVDLHELAAFERAYGRVELAEQARDRGLARAGVAGENHVQAHGRGGQPGLQAQRADFDEVYEALDLLLYVFEAYKAVELGHELVQRAARLLGHSGFRLRLRGLGLSGA